MTDPTPKTPVLNDIYARIQDDLDRVERLLQDMGRSRNALVSEINGYLFQKGGKRVRPALLILSAKLHGFSGDDHIFWSALVEVIHTASLIHDDIIDQADRRRGRDTVHARWDSNITVLLGDYLYIRAIQQALQTRRMEIIDIMADVTARMIEGELLECSVSGDPDLDEDTYFKILELKTAALFSAACRIGGILGGAGKADVDRLGAFGTNIGLAFQIADDLLDFTGDASSLGKPVLSDLREGRTTLPIILALRTLQGQARDDFRRLILDRPSDPASLGRIRDITAAQGALEEAARTGARYSAAAKAYLDGYAPSIEVETLRRIGDFVLERTR